MRQTSSGWRSSPRLHLTGSPSCTSPTTRTRWARDEPAPDPLPRHHPAHRPPTPRAATVARARHVRRHESRMNRPLIFLASTGKQAKLLQAITRGLEDVADAEPWTTTFNP